MPRPSAVRACKDKWHREDARAENGQGAAERMNSTMAAFGHPEAGLERHREPVHDVSGSTLPRNKKSDNKDGTARSAFPQSLARDVCLGKCQRNRGSRTSSREI